MIAHIWNDQDINDKEIKLDALLYFDLFHILLSVMQRWRFMITGSDITLMPLF